MYVCIKKKEISETLQPVENRKTNYFSTFFSNMYSYFLNANEPRGSSILHMDNSNLPEERIFFYTFHCFTFFCQILIKVIITEDF